MKESREKKHIARLCLHKMYKVGTEGSMAMTRVKAEVGRGWERYDRV